MKRIILLLILIPTLLFSQDHFDQEGQNVSIIQAGHCQVFQIYLRGNGTQYFFKLNGESVFNFQIIEPSGNEWKIHVSDNNEIMVWENIMDKGYYEIRIFTIARNKVKLVWGEY